MLGLGSLLRLLSPLLFQGFEIYKNWKNNRVIRDLERKVKSLRVLAGILMVVILFLLGWILLR
jgi:hypothetical protein